SRNDLSMRENEADAECPKFRLTTNYSRKIGILDFGSLGCEVAKRAPLCAIDNVVLSPHLSRNTEESWQNRNQLAHQILLAFLNNKTSINQVC
ncbi:MAG TPA: hypothetical protein QF359_13420, partial [Rhodospirillales bacterium]|nr:hypothetical protein [Rhodospirillales bacterium]